MGKRLFYTTLVLSAVLVGVIMGIAWGFDFDHATWMGIH